MNNHKSNYIKNSTQNKNKKNKYRLYNRYISNCDSELKDKILIANVLLI